MPPYDYSARILGNVAEPHLVVAFARRRHAFSFVTRATRAGGRWSHTALFDPAREVFHEALMFAGVVETPASQWFGNYSETCLIAVSCPRPSDGWAFAHAQTGKGYDYWGAASVPWRRPWQDPDRWYCSEKDAAVLAAAGRPLFRDAEFGVHPHDLYRVAM